MQSPLHFLIVEDVPWEAELVCRWLKKSFRCEFTCVDRRSEAVRVFRPGRFSAAFVNLCLQHNRTAGLDVIQELRRAQPDLPIIVVSGHDEERLRRRAIECGVEGFFNKEFDSIDAQLVVNLLRLRFAAYQRGRLHVAKSWRTTMWGSVAALGGILFAVPTALILVKSQMPEMAEIVNSIPPKVLGYCILLGAILGPFGTQMMGKVGRDQKEAEKFWEEHSKTCPGHVGPDETETKT
jgi:CheY-like chemotaxis protein